MAVTLKGQAAVYEGTSTDTKPTDADNNAIFRELDTGIRYYYDGTDWNEIPSSGGGGGGGGTDNYNELSNKPLINSVTLSGNKTAANLGLQAEITGDVKISSDNVDDTGTTNLFVTSAEKSTWNGKQDALTIDSAPTESSTNPVQSGGVYTALSGKQDTLSFDGTYNASTNKAATESTVTTAIGNLDKSSVGLDNVTNNAQIKALSGSVTSGGVVTFGADGATVQDSGKTIETSLSDSNDKIPTSKAVRDNVAANATMASGYTADSAEASITSSTNINDAIEQLDYRTTSNKNNILYNANNGVKNLCKPNVSADSEVTYTVNADNSITITCNTTALREVHIFTDLSELTDGKDYILSGCNGGNYSNTYGFAVRTSGGTGKAFESDGETTFTKTAEMVKMDLIIRSGQSWTKTFYPMIRPASIPDPTYQPYALPNAAITPALKECVDNGVKNLLNNKAISSSIYTVNADKTVTANGTGNATITLATLTASEAYALNGMVLSGCPSGGSDSSYKLIIQKNSSPWNVYVRDLGNGAIISGIPEVACVVMIQVMADTTVSNLVFKPMICTQADWNVSHTYFPYAINNAELTAKVNQIGLKLVKSQTVASNTEVTYAMNKNDFIETSPNPAGSIGTYIISVMPWSTAPNFSLYSVSYTDGSLDYTSIVKIAGADRTVTVSSGVISISGFPSTGAKVSIHAML